MCTTGVPSRCAATTVHGAQAGCSVGARAGCGGCGGCSEGAARGCRAFAAIIQRGCRIVHGARAGWVRTCARWSCSYASSSATGWACGAPMNSGAPKGDCTASTSSGGTWCVRNVCAACTRRAGAGGLCTVRAACVVHAASRGSGGGEDRRHLGQAALGLDEVPAVVAGERRPRARAQAEGLRERAEDHEASSEHPRRAARSRCRSEAATHEKLHARAPRANPGAVEICRSRAARVAS